MLYYSNDNMFVLAKLKLISVVKLLFMFQSEKIISFNFKIRFKS